MNKRGFTLIEILVAIVVLSAILIIAVPKVFTLLDNSKKAAFKITNSIIRKEIIRENSVGITPQVYTFTNGVMSPDIGIKGRLPESGTIEINNEGEIQILTSSGEYCAIKRFDEDVIAVYHEGDSLCNLTSELSLIINPNGGLYDGITENITYQILPDGKIVLETPTKDENVFAGWDVNCDECLEGEIYTVGNTSDTITATWQLYSEAYTYTGNSTITEDSNGNWKINFLNSGTFTPLINMTIDAFLVGGGGGGSRAGAGGGGGYTKTSKIIMLTANTTYTITVGVGGAASTSQGGTGGTTTAFGISALGGTGGANTSVAGAGNGGSGGGDPWSAGGTNGSKGIGTNGTYGIGQITTTREFSEITGTLYAAGGGGEYYSNPIGGRGVSGAANTGSGGSSNYSGTIGSGGSGIVVIKSSNPTCVGSTTKYCFKYTALYSVDNSTTDNYKIKFLESGTLKSLSSSQIDAFLVGGGGGGETNCYICSGAGSGYTTTVKKVDISSIEYTITIGSGGSPNTTQGVRGGTTTAFSSSASGGYGGGEVSVAGSGNGGSGGGDFGYTGGTDGANGNHTNGSFGVGQATSTREFSEITGTLYATGGSGGNAGDKGASGTSNTGNGAASNCSGSGGKGGSGIVVIRKSTPTCVGDTTEYCFRYSGYFTIDDQTEDTWRIKFLTSGTFEPTSNISLDAFLVGGGGGGGSRAGGGGGGGYTLTQSDISIAADTPYTITIGAGGAKGINEGTGGVGGTTSAFTYSALGGTGGAGNLSSPQCKGGSGGSGGGGGTGYENAGGSGGNDGNNGITGVLGTYGIGQGTTTRAFAEPTGILYGSGGGGGNIGVGSNGAGSGGNLGIGFSATANTGGGGGGGGSGASYEGGLGGSGIVIIRKS